MPILTGGRAALSYRDAIDSVGGRLISSLEDLYASLAVMEQERVEARS
jgi:hypothetical protein